MTASTGATVVVVGSVNMDSFFLVDHLPREGETVAGGTHWRSHGGKGANQAAAAAALGARTALVAAVGDDLAGAESIEELARRGVDTLSVVRHRDAATGLASIVVDRRGRNQIAVASGANLLLDVAAVEAALGRFLAAVVLVCLEVPDEAVSAAVTGAAARGWPVVLNPAPYRTLPGEILARVTVLTPNEREAAGLLEAHGPPGQGPLRAVLLTRGEAGATLMTPAGLEEIPAPAVDPVDTTGAGDVLNGALAAGLARGLSLSEAARRGVAAASLATEHRGARSYLPGLGEVEALLGGPGSSGPA